MTLATITSHAGTAANPWNGTFPRQGKSSRINEICKALNHFGISSEAELYCRLPKVMKQLAMTPSVFKNYEGALCYALFKQAVKAYETATDVKIPLEERDGRYFSSLLEEIRNSPAVARDAPKQDAGLRELERIGKSYDRLESSLQSLKETDRMLSILFQTVEYIAIPHIILGLGDAGTTLWLEKCAGHHQTARQQIEQGQFPDVVLIGQSIGCMKNSYALAQTHNVLERGTGVSNSADFSSTGNYRENQFVDGRHLFQSNMVNLGKTGAPVLLNTTVTGIGKKGQSTGGWHFPEQEYRLKVQTFEGKEKWIYTNQLDVCTGLGNAKKGLIQEIAGKESFERLNRLDGKKGYPPLMDGDRYIFNFNEGQLKPGKRTVLIFGGGDTSAAAYRKAYFGKDYCLKEYGEKERKNDVLWFSSHGFARIGCGKMPQKALENARETGALFEADLKGIASDPETGKLKVSVALKQTGIPPQDKTTEESSRADANNVAVIECDQLIYSIGQVSEERAHLFQQLMDDVVFDYSSDGGIMGMKTTDGKVHFLGAAAQTMGGTAYADAMFDWLARNRISDDSASPAVLPPSRALIKLHAVEHGAALCSVNANTDDLALVKKLLVRTGASPKLIEAFLNDLIVHRRMAQSGMPHSILHQLIVKHGLDALLTIKGHSLIELPQEGENR